MGETIAESPIALGPGEGEGVKADRPELSLLEVTFDPGSGVDPHLHKRHSDSFFVLDGEIEFLAGTASAGAVTAAPPGVVHGLRRPEEPARLLNVHAPDAGFAGRLRAQ